MATVTRRRKSAEQYGSFVEEHLHQAQKRIRTLDLIAGGCAFVAGTVAYAVVLTVLDHSLRLSLTARMIAFGVYFAAAIGFLGWFIVRPILRSVNPYYAAQKMEGTLEGNKNSVTNYLDLKDQGLAPAIQGALGQHAARELAQAKLDKAVSSQRAGWAGGTLAGLLLMLFIVLIWLGAPTLFSHLGRAFIPFKEISIVDTTRLTILKPEGGDVTVPRNRPVTIMVQVEGDEPEADDKDALELSYRRRDERQPHVLPFQNEGPGYWSATIPAAEMVANVEYWVTGGGATTGKHTITVRNKASIVDEQLRILYKRKSYRGEPEVLEQTKSTVAEASENQSVSVHQWRRIRGHRGTLVTVDAPADCKIKRGYLQFQKQNSTTVQRIDAQLDVSRKRMEVSFPLTVSGRYNLRFDSADGESYNEPWYVVEVHKPRILEVGMRASFQRPDYFGDVPPRLQIKDPKSDPNDKAHRQLRDYQGTVVTLTIPTNYAIKDGKLELRDKDKRVFKAIGNAESKDPMALRFDVTLEKNAQYRVQFTTEEGDKFVDAGWYPIEILTGNGPHIQLTEPGQDEIELPANGQLKLKGLVTEDIIGVKSVEVEMRVMDGPQLRAKPYEIERLANGSYPSKIDYQDHVDLGRVQSSDGKAVRLQKGQVLLYRIKASDACTIPKSNVRYYPEDPKVWRRVLLTEPLIGPKSDDKRKEAEQEKRKHEEKRQQERRNQEQEQKKQAEQQRKENEQKKEQQKRDQEKKNKEQNQGKRDASKTKEQEQKEREQKLRDALNEEKKKEQDKGDKDKQPKPDQEPKKGSAKDDPEKKKQDKKNEQPGQGKGEQQPKQDKAKDGGKPDSKNKPAEGKQDKKDTKNDQKAGAKKEPSPSAKNEQSKAKPEPKEQDKNDVAKAKERKDDSQSGKPQQDQTAKGKCKDCENPNANSGGSKSAGKDQPPQQSASNKEGPKDQGMDTKPEQQASSAKQHDPQKNNEKGSTTKAADSKGAGKGKGADDKQTASAKDRKPADQMKETSASKGAGKSDKNDNALAKNDPMNGGAGGQGEKQPGAKDQARNELAKRDVEKDLDDLNSDDPEKRKQALERLKKRLEEEKKAGGGDAQLHSNLEKKLSNIANGGGGQGGGDRKPLTPEQREQMKSQAEKEREQLEKDLASDDPKVRDAAREKIKRAIEELKKQGRAGKNDEPKTDEERRKQVNEGIKDLVKDLESKDKATREKAEKQLDDVMKRIDGKPTGDEPPDLTEDEKKNREALSKKMLDKLQRDAASDDPEKKKAAEEQFKQLAEEMKKQGLGDPKNPPKDPDEQRKQVTEGLKKLAEDLKSEDKERQEKAAKALDEMLKKMKQQQGKDGKRELTAEDKKLLEELAKARLEKLKNDLQSKNEKTRKQAEETVKKMMEQRKDEEWKEALKKFQDDAKGERTGGKDETKPVKAVDTGDGGPVNQADKARRNALLWGKLRDYPNKSKQEQQELQRKTGLTHNQIMKTRAQVAEAVGKGLETTGASRVKVGEGDDSNVNSRGAVREPTEYAEKYKTITTGGSKKKKDK